MKMDDSNVPFRLALDLVNQGSASIFLTGKAGTGKTTFLKFIRETSPKQMVVVAPTGVAAINAGGVTIHSFFQLPLVPYIPESLMWGEAGERAVDKHALVSRLRFNKEKLKILRELELLVIDEVSMVRCDTIDAIDQVLRHSREKPSLPFGGVQLLLIGDLFQLPPVVKDDVWGMLAPHYKSPFFFDSEVMKSHTPLYVEFTKIYRQNEERFIELLNDVRNNTIGERGLSMLEDRYSYDAPRGDGHIILTTHNEKARRVNTEEANRLEGAVKEYKAIIADDFPENSYPADLLLGLKVGAQVMFIRNDSDREKRYFNGKIAVVSRLGDEEIEVIGREDGEKIVVGREKWENVRYALNGKTRSIETDVLGSFSQFPLRLAWAITIHKSQGLTFDKVIIDAGQAFAPGQVYVALSRCRTLDGIILESRITRESVRTDPRIVNYVNQQPPIESLHSMLESLRRSYQLRLLEQSFSLSQVVETALEWKAYVSGQAAAFNSSLQEWMVSWCDRLQQLNDQSVRFIEWLSLQFQKIADPLVEQSIGERVVRARQYYKGELGSLMETLKQSPAVTDSRLNAKEYNDMCRELFMSLALQDYIINGLSGIPDALAWHDKRKSFVAPGFSVNAYAAGSSGPKVESRHPLLYQKLKRVRDQLCEETDLPVYLVASSASIEEMARFLPLNTTDLQKIAGFGKAKSVRFGNRFLDVINEYCAENKLETLIHESHKKGKPSPIDLPGKPKREKGDTKAESYRLFREGLKVEAIAAARSLKASTIETHLLFYVGKGEIAPNELLDQEVIDKIESLISELPRETVTSLKARLDPSVSFNAIRVVIAYRTFLEGK